MLDTELMSLYGEASFALGQLNEMSSGLPDSNRFIKAYVIKEALLSSQIEGIHTTWIDVLTHNVDASKPNKETQLVLNYTHALQAAVNLVQEQDFPLVSRVILQAHEVLMSCGQGDRSTPGRYRQQSVRVGELVPPPAPAVANLMRDLETYMNEPTELPILIRTGLVHVHFETIHPFLDGNGRIGRLLIVLMLMKWKLLYLPILYPSYYFKKNRLQYYQKLNHVRTKGDFEGWIFYYLEAIRSSAVDAYWRAKEIEDLDTTLQNIIQNSVRFAKTRDTASQVLNFLFTQPIATISQMSHKLDRAYNTIKNTVKHFAQLQLVSEHTMHKRNKVYRFKPYLALLEKEYT